MQVIAAPHSSTDATQKRVFLWGSYRSGSTAFCRAMMSRPDTKVFIDPYTPAFDHADTSYDGDWYSKPSESCTLRGIRESLELPLSEHQCVFAKDTAQNVVNKLGFVSRDGIPETYIHTFIIRHPRKIVHSLYKLSLQESSGMQMFFFLALKDLYALFHVMKKEMGECPVVVDFDDLLQQPENILKSYCEKVGLTYDPAMLHWKPLTVEDTQENPALGGEWAVWYKEVLSSTGFHLPKGKDQVLDHVELPDEYCQIVDDLVPYYNELYQCRLRPSI